MLDAKTIIKCNYCNSDAKMIAASTSWIYEFKCTKCHRKMIHVEENLKPEYIKKQERDRESYFY